MPYRDLSTVTEIEHAPPQRTHDQQFTSLHSKVVGLATSAKILLVQGPGHSLEKNTNGPIVVRHHRDLVDAILEELGILGMLDEHKATMNDTICLPQNSHHHRGIPG